MTTPWLKYKDVVANQTADPGLWLDSYWGQLPAGPFAEISEDILRNRNCRAETIAVPARITWGLLPIPRFDHPEAYRQTDGKLLVFVSNYRGEKPPAGFGMEEVAPLYSEQCTTFAATYADGHEFQKIKRQVLK